VSRVDRQFRELHQRRDAVPPPKKRRRRKQPAEPDGVYRMSFGKHKGQPAAEIPDSYLTWALRQDWLDAETRTALTVERERRKATT